MSAKQIIIRIHWEQFFTNYAKGLALFYGKIILRPKNDTLPL